MEASSRNLQGKTMPSSFNTKYALSKSFSKSWSILTVHFFAILNVWSADNLCAPSVKVLPWVVDGAGGLGAGKTSGAGTRGVDLNAAIGGRTGDSNTNRGESSNNRSKIHVECYPAENPSL